MSIPLSNDFTKSESYCCFAVVVLLSRRKSRTRGRFSGGEFIKIKSVKNQQDMTKSRILPYLIGASLGALLPSCIAASHAVTTGHIALDLVESLVPNGAGITVVGAPTLTGYSSGGVENYGEFALATPSSGIPFSSGVILATGDIRNSVGPNNNIGVSSAFDAPGSALLPGVTKDAAVLTFSFISATPTISFQYMFASEEYNALFTSEFNDPFRFVLNGPGAANLNLAKVPSTLTDVGIGTVNGSSNSQYFYDNNASGYDIQYNGLAGSLGGQALFASGAVTPGQTYTLSIVIGDGNDSALDSALFLKEGSFQADGFEATGVPEPATWIGGLSIGLLLARRMIGASK
jgi:hypothetical protein